MVSHFFSLMSSGPGNFCLVHVSLVPVLNVVGEQVIFSTKFDDSLDVIFCNSDSLELV
jgi:hypothetical protein